MTTDTKAAAPRYPVISVLEAVRNRIASGWRQGGAASTRHDEPTCLGVALEHAANPNATLLNEARDSVCRAVGLRFGDEYAGQILHWNDKPGRTQAEVLAALDRAIAVERGTATEGSP